MEKYWKKCILLVPVANSSGIKQQLGFISLTVSSSMVEESLIELTVISTIEEKGNRVILVRLNNYG